MPMCQDEDVPEMSVFKGTEKVTIPLGHNELGRWRDDIRDTGRDKNMSLVGLGKEFVFPSRGNGINIS